MADPTQQAGRLRQDIEQVLLWRNVEQVLRDDAAVRDPDPDPELEALQRAILLEEHFGITLADDEIDPATLATAAGVYQVVSRYLSGR